MKLNIDYMNLALAVIFSSITLLMGVKTFYFINAWDITHSRIFSTLHWMFIFAFILTIVKNWGPYFAKTCYILGIPVLILLGVDLFQQLIFEEKGDYSRLAVTIASLSIYLCSLCVFYRANKLVGYRSLPIGITFLAIFVSSLLVFYIISGHELIP